MKAVPLAEVCRIVNGGTPKSGIADYWKGDVAWLTPAEMGKLKSPYIHQTARTITQAGLKNSSARQVPVSAVIMSTRAPIGHLAIPEVPMAFNQGCRGLVPNEHLDTKYLYYFLFLSREALNDLGTGATFKELASSALGKFPIPLPPLEEQRQIVAVLDEAFATIAAATVDAEKNLINAQVLFGSYLHSTFTQQSEGWVKCRLKDVCEKITDGTHQTPKYFKEGIVFLSSRNVTSGRIDWDNVKYIDEDQHAKMHKRVAPKRGDILLAKNGTTGVAAIVDRDTVFDIYVSLACLRALPVIRPEFLLYFINSPVAKSQFNKRLKGTGVPNLHLEEIREVLLSFPANLTEQDRMIKQLDAIRAQVEDLERIFRQKLSALIALEQSLLHHAFTGKLTATRLETIAA